MVVGGRGRGRFRRGSRRGCRGGYWSRLRRLRTRDSRRSRATLERFARLRLTWAHRNSTAFSSGAEAGRMNTVSQSRALIRSRMAWEMWVLSRSQTSTIGALTSWWIGRSGRCSRVPTGCGARPCDRYGTAAGGTVGSAIPAASRAARRPRPSPSPSGNLHHRGDTAPSPRMSLGRPAGEPGFVLEADPSFAGRPAAFTSVQVASFHAVTACSSRSAARRTGTGGVKPSRCIGRVAPETL